MKAPSETLLGEKVSKIEEKVERIENAKNIEARKQSATTSIQGLNSDLASLKTTAEELAFYVDVLNKVFDDERPNDVKQAIAEAQEAAKIKDEAVLAAAERQDFRVLDDQVNSAEESLENAIESVTNHITDEYQSEWEKKLDSARELSQIIGGSDNEFIEIISQMEAFLERAIWNTDKRPQTLASRWARLRETWRENSGKHGWEAFQEENDLSDATIDDLKQFTSTEIVRLSDLSLTTLEEVKQVNELESALQVELKS